MQARQEREVNYNNAIPISILGVGLVEETGCTEGLLLELRGLVAPVPGGRQREALLGTVVFQQLLVQRFKPVLELKRVGIQVLFVVDLSLIGHRIKASQKDPYVVKAQIEAGAVFQNLKLALSFKYLHQSSFLTQ